MAIYHLSHGFVSRSTGRTSVQSAAYICGEKLHEDLRNRNVSYSNRTHDVAYYKTIAPEHSKYKDLSVWNSIENFENKYADSFFKKAEAKNNYLSSTRTARTIVLALPKELSNECNIELVERFSKENFLSRNLITTYAIHNKEGNPHAHLQISLRAIGEDGEFVNHKDRGICARSFLLSTRKLFSDLTNELLAREGFEERVTEKSFADLGINLEPIKHRGWHASQLGLFSRITQENLEASKRNEEELLSNPSIILDYLNATRAAFTQKDILKEISKRVFDERNVSLIFEKVLESSISIGESINGEFLYTGEKYQKLETDVLSKFDEVSSQTAIISGTEKTVSDVLRKYDYLSEEQKSAVIGLTKDDNFGILLGKAGAGKTTTMKAISEIYEQSGSRVIGMSISAVASENLGKDAGIESSTIASWSYRWRLYEAAKEKFLSFDSVVTDGILKQLDWYNDLKRYESSQLKSGDVIIVDEAGMVGTQEWKTILDAAKKFNAKVIAVGDDNQFKTISAGDCFSHFKKRKENICELKEIRRQKEPWMREASIEFSKMNVGAALEKYEHHGKIHAISDNAETTNTEVYKQIAEKYLEFETLGTAAVLCSTNDECMAVNAEVRSLKKAQGEIGEDLVNVNHRSFSERDRIIFLENNKGLDVKNGQTGTVESFNDGILSVKTESGTRSIDIDAYPKLGHAYAITLHKSQGKTYDNTILLMSKEGVTDAKSMYVGMTRHRDNVEVYYSQSDFSSFKSLVESASKYSHKDSLVDYEYFVSLNNNEPHQRARVMQYQALRLEAVSVLRDIRNEAIADHASEAKWKEYNALKSKRLKIEKEILGNYDSHKLYLDQLGITKEKLEVSAGLKPRAMTKVELEAKNMVALYAKTSQDARAMFNEMKKSSFNVTKHKNYSKYCDLRNQRNDLAEKILSNRPLHREFVSELSRKYFISFKSMESQVSYGRSLKQERLSDQELREQGFDPERRAHVSLYAGLITRLEKGLEVMSKDVGVIADRASQNRNISKHRHYKHYQELLSRKDEYGRMIMDDIGSYEKHCSKYGITRESLEKEYGDKGVSKPENETSEAMIADRLGTNYTTQISSQEREMIASLTAEERADFVKALISNLAASMSAEKRTSVKEQEIPSVDSLQKSEITPNATDFEKSDIFAKLKNAKDKNYSNNSATQLIFESLMMDKKEHGHKENMAEHLKDFGYAQHVSKPTVYAFCEAYDISNNLNKGQFVSEYASMLVQQKLDSNGLKEATPEIVESSVKQALCFKALKNASNVNTKELTPELAQELHNRASVICGYLTSENIHVLQDKALMKEMNAKIYANQRKELTSVYVDRIIDVHNGDMRKESLLQKEQQHEQYQQIDTSKEFEMSI